MRLCESEGTLGRSFGEGSRKTALARFEEPHYTVAQIGEIWNLSRDVVRKIFEHEPGVFVIGNNGSRSKRGYTRCESLNQLPNESTGVCVILT